LPAEDFLGEESEKISSLQPFDILSNQTALAFSFKSAKKSAKQDNSEDTRGQSVCSAESRRQQ
jgi:hypothetical protein